jgi:hypothetical protein
MLAAGAVLALDGGFDTLGSEAVGLLSLLPLCLSNIAISFCHFN